MRVIPVIDLMGGIVVRGIAGRRQEYRPLVTRLTTSVQPVDVARALAVHFGFREFYLADLDAIGGAEPDFEALDELAGMRLRLWIDAGVRDAPDALRIAGHAETVVLGLETLAGPESLTNVCRILPAERLVFSLDLRSGQPLCDMSRWPTQNPAEIITIALEQGVKRILILDLARVGTAGGPGSLDLCKWARSRPNCLEVSVGGGIRGAADLEQLKLAGADVALMASALHDGMAP